MSIDSTTASAASGTATSNSAAKGAMTKLSGDFDSFLKLLTAQVSNQDPLEPMDSTTFVTQLAQLSQVEQSVMANTNLEQIAAKLASAADLSGIQLIGRDVTLPADRIERIGGEGLYDYELEESAHSVRAEILDANGDVLRTVSGLPTEAGARHRFRWDGLDANGATVEDGAYGIRLVAQDSQKGSIGYSGYATTRVERVSLEGAQPMLVLRNGTEASSGSVLSVQ
ncbi:hypothetical protein BV394_05380 [Brevirhabdus pacifica]|uniref:Basal-body rod modification protein FlgD n=1 Tax=Brevirhabdus pacifica TaxID=1267768 RepID=A0A1U7DGW9_9RHOB|nr:flagellar hook assembly protein FlgD [Brevirhabdus pacifica]APX89216.1 hypothetical protein BV394_05380 [Brevirhabdus pacifica]OWU76737.1 hypothetical protein ATO5_10905 [Loktanella sp. 22II-4b]PJJ86179.1 flagellar basal-body rod modification protein FlgD [Brevirhabdus pacifica]